MSAGHTRTMRLSQTARAKINLNLHVTGRNADGYHLLDSVVVFADLGDELVLTRARQTMLQIRGPFGAGLETGRDNLILAAFDRLNTLMGGSLEPAGFELVKNLPVASGIGGGSADAAAALRGLIDLYNLQISQPDLKRIALSIGADVPVCLASKPVRMSGIGEHLAALENLPPFDAVLVNPGVGVSTRAIFENLAITPGKSAFAALPDIPADRDEKSWLQWLMETRNDLQKTAEQVEPVITQVIAALRQTPSCHLARMSGSGATCFALYANGRDAHNAAQVLTTQHPKWWVRAVRLGGSVKT